MILKKIAKLADKLVSQSQRINSSKLMLENVRMSLDLLRHPSIWQSQGMHNRLEGTPFPDMNRKINFLTGNYWPTDYIFNYKRSSVIYNAPHSWALPFWNTPLTYYHSFASYWCGGLSTHSSHYIQLVCLYSSTKAQFLASALSLLPLCSNTEDNTFPVLKNWAFLLLSFLWHKVYANATKSSMYSWH